MSLPTPGAKLAVALVGAAAVAGLLGGCGSSHDQGSTPPPVAAPTTSAAPTTVTTRPGHPHPVTSSTSAAAPDTQPTAPAETAATSTTTEPATTVATTVPPTSAATSTTVPASTTTSVPTDSQVRVLADCQSPSYEPTTIIVACGDGGVSATQISWTSWGATSAAGTAVIVANLCNPNCAEGNTGSFPATITLSGVEPGPGGELFSTLTAAFSGASPTGTPSETFSLAPIN